MHVEEGLEMGVRQHPACPREVLYPGLSSPVWAPRMKEQEAQKGQAGEDWGTDGAGLRTQGLALRGEVELAPNARRGLAVSVWAELTATAVPTGSPWGEGGGAGLLLSAQVTAHSIKVK